jgi:hypothetical protein
MKKLYISKRSGYRVAIVLAIMTLSANMAMANNTAIPSGNW